MKSDPRIAKAVGEHPPWLGVTTVTFKKLIPLNALNTCLLR